MPNPEEELLVLEELRKAIGTSFTEIVPRDKPDFMVFHRGSKVGIEITDGSSEEFKRGLVLAKKHKLSSFGLDGFQERPKKERRTNEELLQMMNGLDFSECETSAIAWSSRIAERIKRKCYLLQIGEIERLEYNWLCVYNFQLDDMCLAASRLKDMLLGALGPNPLLRSTFDTIYVLSQSSLIMINADHVIPVNRQEKR